MPLFEKQPAAPEEVQVTELQDKINRLQRAVDELSVLNDLARAIGALSSSEEIIGIIVRRSVKATDAEQGVITLVSEEPTDIGRTLVRTMRSSAQQEHLHLADALIGWMHLNKKPLLLNSPRTDPRFQGMRWHESIRSLICVPLIVKSGLRGVLTVYNKKSQDGFTQDDQRLLGIIAGQSAQVIENARLLEKERSLLAVQEELKLAARIQLDLLPKTQPAVAGYDIYGKSIPAREVGGDYFDFMTIDETRLGICLGDVTGKGMGAAMLMANVQATLRSQAFLKCSAQDSLINANKLLYESTPMDKFVTLFYGILDFANHRLLFSNAGHDPPFCRLSDGSLNRLKSGGMILGAFGAAGYQQEEIDIPPGTVLMVYSDGIPEAMNANREFFGEGRLEQVFTENVHCSAADIAAAIIGAVKAYAGAAEQSDDITIMIIKREK